MKKGMNGFKNAEYTTITLEVKGKRNLLLLVTPILGGQISVFVVSFGLRSGSACDARRSPRWTSIDGSALCSVMLR
jgi:hypothetical protein